MKLRILTILIVLITSLPAMGFETGECPVIAESTLNGERLDVRELTSKIVIVEYWATWCAPCVTNLRHLLLLQNKYDGVQVVGINSESDAAKVSAFLQKWGLPVMTLWDRDQKLLKSADPSSLPYTIVLDQTGCVIWRGNGASSETLKSLDVVVSRHVGGT